MNNMIREVKSLVDDFVDETENGFCESVYERYYAYLAVSFCEAVSELCKIIIFGRKYSLSARELYDYDHYLATEAWNDHVSQQFGDFRDWVNGVIWDELNEFTEEFQQWLASQDDEWASDVIAALMVGDIDLEDAVYEWLYDRLSDEAWDYPA